MTQNVNTAKWMIDNKIDQWILDNEKSELDSGNSWGGYPEGVTRIGFDDNIVVADGYGYRVPGDEATAQEFYQTRKAAGPDIYHGWHIDDIPDGYWRNSTAPRLTLDVVLSDDEPIPFMGEPVPYDEDDNDLGLEARA